MSVNNNVVNIGDLKEYKALPYSVTRKVLKQNELEEITGYDRQHSSPSENLIDGIKGLQFKNLLFDAIPVLKWLPEYKIEKNLMGDVISGITVAVMHIPQG